MSFDINDLKNLLDKLLGSRLEKLEKRNQEQLKDLKTAKIQYKKQGDILSNIIIKKPNNNINKKKTNNNSTFLKRSMSKSHRDNKTASKLKLSIIKNKNVNENSRNKFDTGRNISKSTIIKSTISKSTISNNRHNYTKLKSRNISNKKNGYSNINTKKSLTPDPKLKRRKTKNENNLKIKPINLNYQTQTNNIENNNNNKNKTKIQKTNTKKEENCKRKRVMVSDIGLEEDEIQFVLEGFKKEDKERKNNEHNNGGSNNINENDDISNDINSKFTNFINSLEGSKIFLLICSFLDYNTKINFLSYSKQSLTHLIFYLNGIHNELLTVNKISSSNTIEDQINNIRNKFSQEELDSPKQAFTLSKGSIKAIDLLNDDTYNKIFKIEKLEPPLDKIIIVYRIFFQLLDKKEFVDIKDDGKFWEKTRNYILNNNNGKTGIFFKECINNFIFTSNNIYKIKKLVNGIENTLKPLTFGNICQTTGLVIFIIKDSLEYCGIIYKDKRTIPSILLHYLESIQTKVDKVENYIEELKNL